MPNVQSSNNKIAFLPGCISALGSDAAGDEFFLNASKQITRLAIGTNGQVKGVASGTPAWISLGTAANVNTGTAAGNVPLLDVNGRISSAVMPLISLIPAPQIVANSAARLALTGLEPGAFVRQADTTMGYMLSQLPASTDANWIPTGETQFDAAAIISGTIATARLGSGTPDGTQVLYGDQTWKAPPVPGKLPATVVTTTSATMAVNAAYTANNAGLVTLALPATSAVGDRIRVACIGAGGFRITQPNAGSQILFGNQATTAGTTGYLDSNVTADPTNAGKVLFLQCETASAIWTVDSPVGAFTLN